MEVVDKYIPLIEGLPENEIKRRVTAYDCVLSRKPLDVKDEGYQAPKPAEPNSKPAESTKPRVNDAPKEKVSGAGRG